MPANGRRHDFGCDAAIYLTQPGAGTRVRSWTPTAQAQQAFLVTHNEFISIADYFTLRDGGKVAYRPTCHYAYHPCDDAVLSLDEMAGGGWQQQPSWTILDEGEIVDGIDELGVLLYGHAKNAYWYGSQLSIEETRRLAPYQNATGLQVTSAVLAGIVWMLENPNRGIVEADEMDFAAAWRSSALISARWSAATPTGRRFSIAANCSPKTLTATIPGSSRTCWCVVDAQLTRLQKKSRPKWAANFCFCCGVLFVCLSDGIFHVAGRAVGRAFCLVELAFSLQLLVAADLAGGIFDGALGLVGGASHMFPVHNLLRLLTMY